MSDHALIVPHGGQLISRFVAAQDCNKLVDEAKSLPQVTLSAKQACDLEMLAIGAFSPLEGFVIRTDFERICRDGRLASGSV